MAGVKLKRLTIHKYPNVVPGTELVFNDTWNVLLGRKGTGKTTLLKLIAMVVRDDFRALKETELSIEYVLGFPRAELDELAPPAAALPCLGKQHNLALATAGFPAEAALDADASFAAAIAHLLDAHELGAALARSAA